MPIDWHTVPDDDTVGRELLQLARELFPLPRSLTGQGVRETLAVLSRELPLEIVETPTGTAVFDWTVPREWNVREAWIEGPDGRRVVDVAESSLHLLGYSAPVDAHLTLDKLRAHVLTHPDDPDLVPYRTSYWQERWGFCMTQRQLDALPEGTYHVVVDSTLASGSLTSGELTIPGETDRQFLLSTYICHPALANDNLSGIVLLWALAKRLSQERLRYTYRLLWGPGTLGALCWLQRNARVLDHVAAGLAISCVGDPGPFRYKRTRRGMTEIDRASDYVLSEIPGALVNDWDPTGGDERQFCSPGFDLPVGAFSRTPHGLFPEYHSSADDLELVSSEALAGSLGVVLRIIDVFERNGVYRNTSPYGEPQLGRRGLYPSVPDGRNVETALLWVLNLSDGSHDLLAIAKTSGIPFEVISDAAEKLVEHRLLEQVNP